MMRLRFSISFLLCILTLAAVSLVVYEKVRFAKRWSPIHDRLVDWETKHTGYYSDNTYSFQVTNRNGINVGVAIGTSYFEMKENGISLREPTVPKTGKYYVCPPGQWVDDFDSALKIWDKL